jgi:hypothetical protein
MMLQRSQLVKIALADDRIDLTKKEIDTIMECPEHIWTELLARSRFGYPDAQLTSLSMVGIVLALSKKIT